MSNSVWPYRWQPTRLPRPWDSPGKNTGVGCHFLLQCVQVKSESEVTQPCLTLSDPMDCSPPGSSIHGTFQASVLEWGAIAFSIASVWDECNCSLVWMFFFYCPSLGLEWKLTFSSPAVTAEFSKFAGILSAVNSDSICNLGVFFG